MPISTRENSTSLRAGVARRVVRLRQLNRSQYRLLFEAAFVLAIAKAAIIFVPFRRIAPELGTAMAESAGAVSTTQAKTAAEVAWALKAWGRRAGLLRQCLAQAIAAQWMLRRRGLGSTLYLGVRKNSSATLDAHAWLRFGSRILVGGETRSGFQVVAKFGYIPASVPTS